MKTAMKIRISLLFVLLGMFISSSAFAKNLTGQCGDDAWFSYDGNGTLTITGTGEVDNSNDLYSIQDDVTTIIIGEGITEIGDSMFYGWKKVANVTFPSTLIEIGDAAFSNCKKITEITLPGSLEDFGTYVFYDTSLEKKLYCAKESQKYGILHSTIVAI